MFNKETLIISLKSFVITAVAALCLAAVNMITLPIIEENNAENELTAKREVLPEATDFISSEKTEAKDNTVTINSVNVGIGAKDNGLCGYVVVLTSSAGYGGDIKVMVGIDKDLKITRVKIMEASETPGLGANAQKPQFIDQFIGKNQNMSVVKGMAGNNEISAIASATITSKAVTSCVNAALDVAREKAEGGKMAQTAQALEKIKQETNAQIGGEGK